PGSAARSGRRAGRGSFRAAASAHLGASTQSRSSSPQLLPGESPAGPAGNMATGGYRTGGGSGGSTTDFLEEWKAKREKMRAKQNPPGPAAPGGGTGDAAGKLPSGALGTSAAAAANELNNNLPGGAAAPAAPGPGGVNCAVGPAQLSRAAPGPRRPEDESSAAVAAAAAASGAAPARDGEEERDGALEKGKSSGPSARKGKGQIEKRKLREKRRSTGVVNIPAAELLNLKALFSPANSHFIAQSHYFIKIDLAKFAYGLIIAN
ncbi:hypothetical protein EI555_011014, partial [Monodon monoceros]